MVAALWFGGVRVTEGSLEVGQLIAFINYLMQTLMSLMMISMLMVRVARAEASAQRIEEVLHQQPDIRLPDALTTIAPRGRLAFENVNFSYDADEHDPVLKGVDFTVEPGQTLAMLGATGSGKSSLVNLIPRFYDVTGGRITLDGVDVRAIDEPALHRAVGVALQETVLFSGTIRDNIRYGRPEATRRRGDRRGAYGPGARFHQSLSRRLRFGGRAARREPVGRAETAYRHRARLLVQPAVLILDDSTSAVDVETEARIQAALDERKLQTRRGSRAAHQHAC